jgi:hypothetical protein
LRGKNAKILVKMTKMGKNIGKTDKILVKITKMVANGKNIGKKGQTKF